MGKTKTAVITGIEEDKGKTSEEKYLEKKAKKNAEEVKEGSNESKTAKKLEVTRSAKYSTSKSKIQSSKLYSLGEAVKLVKEASYSKFDGTIEVHIVAKKTGINTQVTLPFSTGKQKEIEIATEKTLKDLEQGKINFDVLLATPDMMPKLIAFAKVLGPKGLMPNPKNGTVIKSGEKSDLLAQASKFGGNSISIKTEKDAPLIHTIAGKVSQKDEELVKNIEAIIAALGGTNQITRAFIKATMSPSVKIQI